MKLGGFRKIRRGEFDLRAAGVDRGVIGGGSTGASRGSLSLLATTGGGDSNGGVGAENTEDEVLVKDLLACCRVKV